MSDNSIEQKIAREFTNIFTGPNDGTETALRLIVREAINLALKSMYSTDSTGITDIRREAVKVLRTVASCVESDIGAASGQ